jgi:hypothetical protein
MELTVSLTRATSPQLLADIRERCEQGHYLHRWPDPRSLPFAYAVVVNGALHAPDGRLNGVLVFKKLQHHKQKNLFGYAGLPTAWQVLDLARVWINPHWQQLGTNLFSRSVSQSLRVVQRDWLAHHPPRFPTLPYHIELVVSYADHRFHRGTAYKACNFQAWGQNDGKTLYIYRLRAPRWHWTPEQAHIPVQHPLLEGMPLRY